MVPLADVIEIQQLLSRYVHLADWLNKGEDPVPGVPTSVGEVFAAGAVFKMGSSTFCGLDAISQLFATTPTVHSTSDAYVYLDGDVIRVRSKFAFTQATTGQTLLGDYDDVVEPTPDGWRIVERVVRTRPSLDS